MEMNFFNKGNIASEAESLSCSLSPPLFLPVNNLLSTLGPLAPSRRLAPTGRPFFFGVSSSAASGSSWCLRLYTVPVEIFFLSNALDASSLPNRNSYSGVPGNGFLLASFTFLVPIERPFVRSLALPPICFWNEPLASFLSLAAFFIGSFLLPSLSKSRKSGLADSATFLSLTAFLKGSFLSPSLSTSRKSGLAFLASATLAGKSRLACTWSYVPSGYFLSSNCTAKYLAMPACVGI